MYKLLLIILFIFPVNLLANAAQPGFWGAGGTGTFSLLYPEDSLQYKKIQMVKELVSIQLYRGYSVVKGEYRMFNDTPDPVTIKVGYPLNSSFKGKDEHTLLLSEVWFDSLYGLRAYKNGEAVTILSELVNNPDAGRQNENWYVWDCTFTPSDTTLIIVYFIVNTNNAIIREGYNNDYNNGFIYLLETGETWKQPIVDGEIRIILMDDLTSEDIIGLSPDTLFRIDPNTKTLLAKFHNLSPSDQNNVIIKYSEKLDDFDFQNVLNNRNELYKTIDLFSYLKINGSNLEDKKFGDPFGVQSVNWLTSLFVFLLFAGGPILLGIAGTAGILILFFIFLKERHKTDGAV